MEALRIKTVADHGYTDAAANPSKFPAGLFHICTGSYDFKDAFVEVDGVYTNKPPGGIAYRCSFRVTEAVYAVERMADIVAHQLGIDPAEFRMKNFVKPDAFPYRSALGWEYDSGDYQGALKKAMEIIDYADLRREQAEKRAQGELMGIGISSFTEIVGAGPSRHFDILGIKMFDSADIRIHPTGKAIARFGTRSQGQGHETTYAQIIAEELGIPVDDITVEEGDTDTAPYGLGDLRQPEHSNRRSRRGRCVAEDSGQGQGHRQLPPRRGRRGPGVGARQILRAGRPDRAKTIQEIAFAAYTDHPPGMEAGLEAHSSYDPPTSPTPSAAISASSISTRARARSRGAASWPWTTAATSSTDDRGGTGARRLDDGSGSRPPGGDRIRRERPEPDQHLHGLPAAHRCGDAGLGDRQDLHAFSPSSARGQGHR